ncbi:hypothetical protein BWI17_01420 [Betaproteobacteria bacterium GR16-43]|nr:hypothetical protein BWI17_01420 [Betaproteobacteria bacterium GR16-43]
MKTLVRVLLGTVALVALGGGGWYAYNSALTQPVREIAFTGDTSKVARADLDKLAESVRAMPPGNSTLVAVREGAKRLPWVRDASVRRRFPDGLEVRLEMHDALARWSDGLLVNPQGELFAGRTEAKLPKFTGPEGSSPEMAREYPGIARALVPIESSLAELHLSPRGAWQVVLDSGLVLELGRGDVVARIDRFAGAWPRLAKADPVPKYADLRYPNGFALKRARDPNDLPTKPASKTKRA